MTIYEKRIRERFPALVADSIWPTVERLVQEDWRDEDEDWFAGVEWHCIDLCKRLGLPFGPAQCAFCQRDWPERDDVPDGGECPECAAKHAARTSPVETDGSEIRVETDGSEIRVYLAGLLKRDVQ